MHVLLRLLLLLATAPVCLLPLLLLLLLALQVPLLLLLLSIVCWYTLLGLLCGYLGCLEAQLLFVYCSSCCVRGGGPAG